MRIASIDIGTNTVLLLIADIDEHGNIRVIEHQQRLPRLGKNVDTSGMIQSSAFDRIAWILNEYKNISLQFKADRLIACATSAVRDASNRKEFLSFLEINTEINVEVLSGKDEAYWTYNGVANGIKKSPLPMLILDIGGGSTELSFPQPDGHNGNSALNQYSFQLGAVRLTERFFKHDPPLPEEIESAKLFIREEVAQVRNPGFHRYQLVGVAGTVTSLACIDQQLPVFDVNNVSGYSIQKERVAGWFAKLQTMNHASIKSLSTALEGRADIFTAGVLILLEVMDLFRIPTIIVSERGLRFGLVLREWKSSR